MQSHPSTFVDYRRRKEFQPGSTRMCLFIDQLFNILTNSLGVYVTKCLSIQAMHPKESNGCKGSSKSDAIPTAYFDKNVHQAHLLLLVISRTMMPRLLLHFRAWLVPGWLGQKVRIHARNIGFATCACRRLQDECDTENK